MFNKILALMALTLVVSCTKQRDQIQPRPEVRAAANISESFLAKTPSELKQEIPEADSLSPFDNYYVAIKKSALDKEFLLSGSLIPQTESATSSGLKGRVVAFKHVRDKVFLMEATQGHVVTTDLPAQLILAEIPIIQESADVLVLDFNKGLSQVFVSDNWYGSDEKGSEYAPSFKSVAVDHSFLQEVSLKSKYLLVRQIAQVTSVGETEVTHPTVEVRYYISPYAPSETFEPKLTSDMRRVGFFEVAPQITEGVGTTFTRISKWELSKPVTYYVSANTPAEYLQAVKDGILYWNQVFGREVIKAEVAPAGTTSPDPEMNIVQWVPNDAAGFAYADALMDPRSGEILHSQIYMTSVFPNNILGRLPSIVRRNEVQSVYGLKFLTPSRLCHKGPSSDVSESLSKLALAKLDKATLLRIANDYVRATVAHEVGHTLGMRHNFAGSLVSEMSPLERSEAFLEYVTKGTAPTKEVSSSIMDYLKFEDDILAQAQMTAGRALSYDKLAMDWGYNKGQVKIDSPLFCTDSAIEKFVDCKQFDAGGNVVVTNAYNINRFPTRLALSLVDQLIARKKAAGANEINFSTFDPGTKTVSDTLAEDFTAQLSWFTPDTRLVSVNRSFGFVSESNLDEVLAKQSGVVSSSVDEAGGVKTSLLRWIPQNGSDSNEFVNTAKARLDELLARPDVLTGELADGTTYTLSQLELDTIRKIGVKHFELANKMILKAALKGLSEAKIKEMSTNLPTQLELGLESVALGVTLAEGGQVSGAGAGINTPIYSLEIRNLAASTLARANGPTLGWGFDARAKVKKALVDRIEKSLGKTIDEIEQGSLSPAVREWLMGHLAVLSTIENE